MYWSNNSTCGNTCFFLWETLTVIFGFTLSCSQQGYSESPDLDFEYSDTDKWTAELSGKSTDHHAIRGAVFLTGL